MVASTSTTAQTSAAPPAGYSDVYIMPEKYILKSSQGGYKGIIIAATILIIVILVTGGYLIYDMISNKPAATVTPAPSPQVEIVTPEPPAETPPIMETPTTTPVETPTTTSATTTAPQTSANVPLAISQDSDADGLTDVEEQIFGTLPTNPDTDGDGYKDGAEVANGYDPTKPGNYLLSASPFVTSLTTNFSANNFLTLYPKEWQTSLLPASSQVLITASTGEIIKISIIDNPQGLSALAWYLGGHPEVAVSQLKIINSGSFSGIYSPDGLTAWLTDAGKSKLYVFEYIIGRQTEIRYPAIFGLIIKGLKPAVLPEVPSPATTTP